MSEYVAMEVNSLKDEFRREIKELKARVTALEGEIAKLKEKAKEVSNG